MCLTVPGQIVSVEGTETRLARVDFGVAVRTANLVYTPEANVGDFVIVQAGFATRVLSAAEAEEALEYHRELAVIARETSAMPSA
ncbi:MAG: HypC/HybG/HupF family hydrogenase formation chaperone [Thermoplasmata archaeon]|jgi:hydrogenase expression/formation protein HypC